MFSAFAGPVTDDTIPAAEFCTVYLAGWARTVARLQDAANSMAMAPRLIKNSSTFLCSGFHALSAVPANQYPDLIARTLIIEAEGHKKIASLQMRAAKYLIAVARFRVKHNSHSLDER